MENTPSALIEWRKDLERRALPDDDPTQARGVHIAKVQEWLGHANISTTRIYDHRRARPENSPTFKIAY